MTANAQPATRGLGAALSRLAADREDVVSAAVLAGLGLISCGIYLVLTLKMPFLEFFPGPGITLDFVKMLGTDWQENTALLVGSFAALFLAFGLAMAWLSQARGPLTVAAIFASAFVFVVVLAFMYPPMAVDFIHNVSDARTLWVYGDNAMVVPPAAHPFPVGQSFSNEPAPYGPLWFLLLFPVLLAGDSIQLALHILKFYTSLFYLGSAVLIFLMARRVTPGREAFALLLYAWNPFVVWRSAGNGHNDVTMFFFVLLALWLMMEGHWRLVLPVLVASALVKYVSLIMIPPVLMAGFLAAEDRHRFWRETAEGAAIAAGLTLVTFSYFWEGFDTFDIAREQAQKFITSAPLVLREWLVFQASVEPATAEDVARWGGILSFAAVYGGLLYAYYRTERGMIALCACLALILLCFSLLAVTWYRPWYMLWPLTLFPLVPGRWPVALLLAISVGGMLPDIVEQYRLNIEFFREHYLWAVAAPVIVAFVPAVVVLLAGWASTRRPLLTTTQGLSGEA